MLERLARLVAELNKTTSVKNKIQILQAYPDLREMLSDIYSNRSFGITSRSISNESVKTKDEIQTIQKLVQMLSTGMLKNSDRSSLLLSGFAAAHTQHLELIKNIVDKNLKARIGPGLLKKAFGNNQWSLPIALAIQYDSLNECKDTISRSLRAGERWLYSRKIDGVRCIAKIDDNRQVQLMSRQSRPFRSVYLNNAEFKKHFDHLLRLPCERGGQSMYLDGELAVIDDFKDDFHENFTSTVRLCMAEDSGNEHLDSLVFFVFDCLTENEINGKSPVPLSQRLLRLHNLDHPVDSRIRLLPQWALQSSQDIDKIIKDQIEGIGWEGAILRKDCMFVGKRSPDMIKLKLFNDAEFRVLEIELAPMRFIDSSLSRDREEIVCKSLIIEHSKNGKTSRVSVGSGMSADERRQFAKNPNAVIGKMITVKYFEETENELGLPSLRFPTFKSIRRE
jgi:ATP-dependent DNA ligase